MLKKLGLPLYSVFLPILSWIVYVCVLQSTSAALLAVLAVLVIGTVMAAVHHAEVVAHKVGEPYGTVILAVAVTIIEVGLILVLMSNGGKDAAVLARDTIYAAVMIVLNGIIGLCLLVGGLKYKEQVHRLDGPATAVITLLIIASMGLIVPSFTESNAGPNVNTHQLVFIGIATLVLYIAFIFVQTVRHRDYFLPLPVADSPDEEQHATPPSAKTAWTSFILLLVCLAAVVLSAKKLSPSIEHAVAAIGAPYTLVGIIVASIVLLPEGIAAVKATRRNRPQTSLNLSIGSALACVGLSIPVIIGVSLFMGYPLTLGLNPKATLLLLLSVISLFMTLANGKTNVMHGIVFLTLFFSYVFLTVVP